MVNDFHKWKRGRRAKIEAKVTFEGPAVRDCTIMAWDGNDRSAKGR